MIFRERSSGVLSMIAAFGLAAGCQSGGTSSSGPPACTSEDVRISTAGAVGATGHIGLTVRIDSVARRACQLSGYPELRLLDGDGRAMATVVEGQGFLTGTRAPVRVVSVPPGGRATFIVEWADAGCPAGDRLGITLPGDKKEAFLPAGHIDGVDGLSIAPCGAQLAVSPILSPDS